MKKILTSMMISALLALALTFSATALEKQWPVVSEGDSKKITEAMPDKAPAKPKQARKILVFCRCEGFPHGCIPVANKALDTMGKKTGAFSIDVADEMKVFTADNLKQYDAILLNNATGLKFDDKEQRKALMDFVQSGKGIIGLHAATDNFPSWPEAVEMMGGLFDGHPWTGGGTWAVKVDEPAHPLNKSFTNAKFDIKDEIYQIKGPYSRDTHRVLLSLDMSDKRNDLPGQNRKDKDNAISWIKKCGKGRVFYCSLGHNNEIFWNKEILGHYLAGIQYALGDLVVDDAPSAKANPKPAPADAADASVPPVTAEMKAFKEGGNRTEFSKYEDLIRKGDPKVQAAIELRLREILVDSGATPDAKYMACRLLRGIATKQSVPALSALLTDKSLSHMARYALQGIADPSVDTALIAVLAKVDEQLKPGIVSTLGERGSAAGVKAIAPFLTNANKDIARAAITALGRAANADAASVLSSASVAADFALLRDHALLECADGLIAAGEMKKAVTVCAKLRDRQEPMVKFGATRCLALAGDAAAVDQLAAMLNSDNEHVRAGALRFFAKTPGQALTVALGSKLGTASPELCLQMLECLQSRGDRSAAAAVTKLAASTNEAVATAAIRALGDLGDASGVDVLLQVAAVGGQRGDAANSSLKRLGGAGVAKALCAKLESGTPDVQAKLLKLLEERRERASFDAVKKLAASQDAQVRAAACGALRGVSGAENLPALVELLAACTTDADRSAVIRAISGVAAATDDKAKATAHVLAALSKANDASAVDLLAIMPSLGTPEAAKAAGTKLSSASIEVRKQAIKSLGEWPTPVPLVALVEHAAKEQDPNCRILAVKGIATLLRKPSEMPNDKKTELCKRAYVLARLEEKKLLLGALALSPCPAALAFATEAAKDPAVADAAREVRAESPKKP